MLDIKKNIFYVVEVRATKDISTRLQVLSTSD